LTLKIDFGVVVMYKILGNGKIFWKLDYLRLLYSQFSSQNITK